MSKKFFELDKEFKDVAKHPTTANPHRGYAHVGLEKTYGITGFETGATAIGPKVEDYKESFDMGSPVDPLYDNRWPREENIPGFRSFMEEFFEACHNCLTEIMTMLAHALGVRAQDIASLHKAKAHELRLLHYPAVPANMIQDGKRLRIAEHTDFGTITLLFQDMIGGLEVENQSKLGADDGQFISVDDKAPTMIVNIGDSLQRWTNASLKAVVHRVRKPTDQYTDDSMIPSRYSIAFFGKPNRDVLLTPFPKFVSKEHPCLYEPITAGNYNQSKLIRTFEI
ncbi:hypothetical protein IL306_005197 [Fusarium sp. DS 682]|nr:hypothetical protein IL306_005197 [Fusarium sp. DS 682]